MDVMKKILSLLEARDFGFPLDKFYDVNAGRFVTVPVNEVREIVSIKGRERKGLHMTVTLINQHTGPSVVGEPATAIVSWGSMGAMVSNVEVDFCLGTVLSLGANNISIVARNDGTAPAQLGAFVSYLPYPGETKAHKTLLSGELLAGNSIEQFLPPFSRFVNVMYAPSLGAPGVIEVEFRDGAAALIATTLVSTDMGWAEKVPIPNGTRRIRVVNTGIVNLTSVAQVFTLAM